MNVRIESYSCDNNIVETDSASTLMSAYINKKLLFDTESKLQAVNAIVISKGGKAGEDADADTISASPLAAVLECPQLVVNTAVTNLSGSTKVKNFLQSIVDQRGKIPVCYIVGGTGAVPDSFIGNSFNTTDLNWNGINYGTEYIPKNSNNAYTLLYYCNKVIRIAKPLPAGQSAGIVNYGRYETAAAVAHQIDLLKGNNGETTRLFFVGGDAMADGYCLCSAACTLKSPILYLSEDFDNQAVYPLLNRYLASKEQKVKKAFIGGGGQRVFITCSKKLQAILKLEMPNCIERIAGQDRFDTSLAIAKEFKDLLGEEADQTTLIILDSDSKKVDAPIIGYYASIKKYPIILARLSSGRGGGIPGYSGFLKIVNNNYDLTPYLLKKRPATIQVFSERRIEEFGGTYSTQTAVYDAIKSYNPDDGTYSAVYTFEQLVEKYEGVLYFINGEGLYQVNTKANRVDLNF